MQVHAGPSEREGGYAWTGSLGKRGKDEHVEQDHWQVCHNAGIIEALTNFIPAIQ